MSTGLFKVYRSSAGSGKTFTLVREYLRLALSTPDGRGHRFILAITFTNKAASEMKQRVFRNLRGFALGENDKDFDEVMFSMIRSELDLSAEELTSRAKKCLESMLHNYSEVAISTIDKFVHGVIRSFARELRLAPDFEIEMDLDGLLEQAVDEMLSKVGVDEKLSKLLLSFVKSRLDEESQWNIKSEIIEFCKNLRQEDSETYLSRISHLKDEDFDRLHHSILKEIKAVEKELAEIAQKGLNLIRESGIEPKDLAYGGASHSFLSKVIAGDLNPVDTQVRKVVESGKHAKGGVDDAVKEQIAAIAEDLSAVFYELRERLDQDAHRVQGLRLMVAGIYPMATYKEVQEEVNRIKERDSLLPINEFNKLVSDVVSTNPAPFIYERIGERYKHFLIDEFQDTSVLQWQNFLPLIENSLSKAFFNMVVGDGKQSIYRWRGGEVEQFARLPEIYKHGEKQHLLEKQAILQRNYSPDYLEANFRSRNELVAFNNELFEGVKGKLFEEHQTIYEHHAQKAHKGSGGMVHAVRIDKTSSTKTFDNFKYILDFISESINSGFAYSDIALLFRKNKDASAVAEWLLSNEIPVVSSESLLVSKDPGVRLLISTLQCMQDPKNVQAGLGMLRSYAELRQENGQFHGSLWEFRRRVKDKQGNNLVWIDAGAFLKTLGLDGLLERSREEGLFELVESLIRSFSLDESPNAYLEFFLEQVHQFAVKRRNDLEAFLYWWEEHGHKLSIRMAEGSQAVTVMTIHKSKGLEFPVVILPFLNWKSKNNKMAWVESMALIPELPVSLVNLKKEMLASPFAAVYEEEMGRNDLDTLNMLYVALTRAKERMYMVLEEGAEGSAFIDAGILALKGVAAWPAEGLRFGEDQPYSGRGEKSAAQHPPGWRSSGLRDHLKFSLEAPSQWSSDDLKDARFRGEHIHRALAGIADDSVLEQLKQLGLPEFEAVNLKPLLASDLFVSWFDGKGRAHAERDVMDAGGRMHRPDRMVEFEHEVHVIDYKTGAVSNRYHAQMQRYRKLLREVFNKEVRAFLVYLDQGKIEEVEEGVDFAETS